MVEEIKIEVELLEEIIAPDLVEIEQNAVGQEYDYLRGYSQARKDIWATFEKILRTENEKENRKAMLAFLRTQAKKYPEYEKDWGESIEQLKSLLKQERATI